MLNFRKLRQDFASSILKEGKELYDKKFVLSAKILHLDGNTIRLSCRVKSPFDSIYESEIEIDRKESCAIDSNCDCTYSYDCQHIAASLLYLEDHFDEIVVAFSQASENMERVDEEIKEELQKTFAQAATKEGLRKDQAYQKEVLREYVTSSGILGSSPFFLPNLTLTEDRAELLIVFAVPFQKKIDFHIYLRLPSRSKPLFITNIKSFLESIYYCEPITLNGKKYFFTLNSFSPEEQQLLNLLVYDVRFPANADEKQLRMGQIEAETLGKLLAIAFDMMVAKKQHMGIKEPQAFCSLYCGHLEEPLCFSNIFAELQFSLEYLKAPITSVLLKPAIALDEEIIEMKDILFFEATKPGLLHKNIYYRFKPEIKRAHLKNLDSLSNMVIPEPLFGTFIENALPMLKYYAKISHTKAISSFITLPYTKELKGRCLISYLNGELEGKLYFIYEGVEIPAASCQLEYSHTLSFVGKNGILARNLAEEKKLIEEIFEDFLYDEKEGIFTSKSEKKIVEFMTEVIPRFQHVIKFECPENLSEQFIYDESSFELNLKESTSIDSYEVELKVDGYLKGTTLDLLWDCLSSKKRFLELETALRDKKARAKIPRILVLDLEKMAPLIQFFDEIGIKKIDCHTTTRPLWSLSSINSVQVSQLPLKFTISSKLQEIQKQIMGESTLSPQSIPAQIKADLRKYQIEGVNWLERLRRMHLNGILADDMGLGKTLQAICAITQSKEENKNSLSLIVTPTSLVHNWKEEFNKFHGKLKVLVVDSTPHQRKKALKDVSNYDVVVTSYNLLQKDIDIYKDIKFDYVILDEAQHIKNRTTRNAKSVKMIQAVHRLILTGTPIENSLEELWSLFDFLMPGLLSSYDRFLEKYIKHQNVHSMQGVGATSKDHLESLKRKVSPFILRRMKEDVLDDLPPVSEIFYHCHLTEAQKELYHSYAASAKEELSRLVKKEGFEKIQIHVLATLTRLKQICCHPAIFAKEKPEAGDSAKYDMLMELLPSLIEGKHKTVIFSQYTKMLNIMREDLAQKGIPFAYLDGSSKNRVEIVKNFNESPEMPIFLVSLKAGGVGLNLVGADTVIHYDMWWNPAVENQATDRVHRLGQKKSVSSYKLITLNTIEEKIQTLQNRKKGLVKKLISSDEEAISKLTWEEVLELLQIT